LHDKGESTDKAGTTAATRPLIPVWLLQMPRELG
jgi:hypothetical protein